MTWSHETFAALSESHELEIAVERKDGSIRPWTPIWVVGVDGSLYVRTWYRRGTGWYGGALRAAQAQVRAGGAVAHVRVDDVGDGAPGVRQQIDDAYRHKYGVGAADRMVGDDAAATTLRLSAV